MELSVARIVGLHSNSESVYRKRGNRPHQASPTQTTRHVLGHSTPEALHATLNLRVMLGEMLRQLHIRLPQTGRHNPRPKSTTRNPESFAQLPQSLNPEPLAPVEDTHRGNLGYVIQLQGKLQEAGSNSNDSHIRIVMVMRLIVTLILIVILTIRRVIATSLQHRNTNNLKQLS